MFSGCFHSSHAAGCSGLCYTGIHKSYQRYQYQYTVCIAKQASLLGLAISVCSSRCNDTTVNCHTRQTLLLHPHTGKAIAKVHRKRTASTFPLPIDKKCDAVET